MDFGKKIAGLVILITIVFLMSVTGMAESNVQYEKIADVPKETWEQLAEKKIYFGHQSVGFNIVDGLEEVLREHLEITLNILESRNVSDETGFFAHSRIGENKKPVSKIEDFVNVIEQELGVMPDAAALKFCYVDAYDKIDVQQVFRQYQDAMKELRQKHPGLMIIHFTMPLRTQQISWKTRVKSLAGKDVWELEDNIKRNEFSALLLDTYRGKEPVFDIARFEASAMDGSVTYFKHKGAEYLSMNPDFSNDGGHLNKIGSKMIAERFLLFLANIL